MGYGLRKHSVYVDYRLNIRNAGHASPGKYRITVVRRKIKVVLKTKSGLLRKRCKNTNWAGKRVLLSVLAIQRFRVSIRMYMCVLQSVRLRCTGIDKLNMVIYAIQNDWAVERQEVRDASTCDIVFRLAQLGFQSLTGPACSQTRRVL